MTYSWFQVVFNFVITSILHNLLMFFFKYYKLITIHVLCFYRILRKIWHLRTFTYCPFVIRIHLCFIHDRFPFFSGVYLLIVYHLFKFFEFFTWKYLVARVMSTSAYLHFCFILRQSYHSTLSKSGYLFFNCPQD